MKRYVLRALAVLMAMTMLGSMLVGWVAPRAVRDAEEADDGNVFMGGEAAEEEEFSEEDIKTGGVLRIGTIQNPSVVGYTPEVTNNSFIQYLRCAYESLLYYAEDGSLIGQLATDWDVDADAAVITFNLLDGVLFADGTPFNAEAVKWNMETYKEAGRSEANYIDSVEVIDDLTVKVTLTEWNSSALEMIGTFIYYMSPTAFEENGVDWMRQNSCGTGPFNVSAFEQGVSVEYARNDNYHVEGQPYLDGIKYTIFSDNTTLENAMKAGELDVITYGNDCDLMKNFTDYPGIIIDKNHNGLGVESTGIIVSSADESDPFYDVRVRQAFCYAVDWDTIVEQLSYGMYQRTNQWAAPGAVTYNTDLKGYTYDPEKAKELLAEAGYADGFDTTFYTMNGGFIGNTSTAVQAQLAEVGINANIEIIDGAKSNDLMANGWTGIYWHWASIGPDLGLFMGRHLDPNGAYYAKGIQHPQDCVDLLNQIRAAKDDETKVDLEWQLQEKIYDEYALFGMPLYVNAAVHMRYDYVIGGQFAKVNACTWSPATTWLNK